MNLDPQILNLLSDYRYWILFPLVLVEGPVAMFAGGFLASAGDMKLHWVIIISIIADLLGDFFYFYLGRFGGETILKKWGSHIGLTEKRLAKLEHMFNKHKAKTILIGKLSHGFGLATLVTAGIMKVSTKEFTIYNGLATTLKVFILVFLGFYYGHAYVNIFKYLKWGQNGFLVLIALAFIIYFGLKYLSTKLEKSEIKKSQ